MLNSRTKDKIYALLSFLTIVLAIGSFALVVNFLLQINNYIFSVNEQTVKEKTTVVDKAGFEIIKEKLKLKEDSRNTLVTDISTPSPSPSPTPSPSPSPSP